MPTSFEGNFGTERTRWRPGSVTFEWLRRCLIGSNFGPPATARSLARVDLRGSFDIDGSFNLNADAAGGANRVYASSNFSGNGQLVVGTTSAANLQTGSNIELDVTNRGRLAPGFSIGTATIDGDFDQDASGVLAVELAGAPGGSHDLLHVSQTAQLAGELEVGLIAGLRPPHPETFTRY